MKKFFFILVALLFPLSAFAGTQAYTTPGAYTFTVPPYTTLTIEAWGGGAGGNGSLQGTNGGQSSWNTTILAGGGKSAPVGSGGSGGTASGGDINTPGGNGGGSVFGVSGGNGGSSPNGGAGGNYQAGTWAGVAPGGGGAGAGGGGGAGAYTKKTYNTGALSVGANISLVVGSAGTPTVSLAGNSSGSGAPGAPGTVKITWTMPPTITLSASPTSVMAGGSSTLTWSSTNATSCSASGGWSGNKAVSGSQILTGLTSTATYTLVCTGAGGSVTKSTTITVTPVPDTTAPSIPTGLSGTAVSSTQINLTWVASTDNVGVTGYKIFRDGVQIGTSVITSYSDSGLTPNTTYHYTVAAYDGAGNMSAQSLAVIKATSPILDTVSPLVSITAPTTATVSGSSVVVTATASDNVGVVGVQFKIDNTNFGTEDMTAPYSIIWDTRPTTNGTHQIQVIARDAAGNRATSTVVVNVNNTYAPPTAVPAPGTYTTAQNVTLAATGATSIRYIINNTIPDCATSTLYTAPIYIAVTTSIQAIACYATSNTSTVTVFAYVISNDTTPPSIPVNISGTAVSTSQANLTWNPSTDNVGVTGYKIFRDGIQVATSTTVSFSDTGLTASTTYSYMVSAYDAAGNVSGQSVAVSVTTTSASQYVHVLIVGLPSGTILTSVKGIGALASSSYGVAGVQFVLDNWANIGPEDTSAPYSTVIAPNLFTNGPHILQAIGRDTAGHIGSSPVVSIIINNANSTPAAFPDSGTYTGQQNITLSAPGAISIRYTLDTATPYTILSTGPAGVTKPTCSKPAMPFGVETYQTYTSPIVLNSSATIQVIACYPGVYPNDRSGVVSFHYTITAPASDKLYGPKIVVQYPTVATSSILSFVIPDFQKHLKKMTGADYPLSKDTSGPGIQLILTSSPDAPADVVGQLNGKGPDAFYIRANSTQLKIIANNDRGLSNGVYYYLESLGVRWLLSGDNWQIVPQRSTITTGIDKLVVPAFELQRWQGGTGGFGSNFWGGTYPGSYSAMTDANAYRHHEMFSNEPTMGGELQSAWIAANEPLLRDNPDYLAKIGCPNNCHYPAEPNPTAGYKVNAANPSAVKNFCTFAINAYHRTKASLPLAYLSLETGDGGLGDDYVGMRAAGVGDGSWSDQAFYIANKCMQMAHVTDPDVKGSILAYSSHADPPSFDLDPGLVVGLIPNAYRSGTKNSLLTSQEFIDLWRSKLNNREMFIYDYWTISDAVDIFPVFNYLAVPKTLQGWYASGIHGVSLESTEGMGTMGPALYLTSHIMWDPSVDSASLLDEWYTLAFGPAKVPMRRMLERWAATSFHKTSDELGLSYQDIQEAEQLANGNVAVQARVDDYAGFLHFLRLLTELDNASVTSKPAAASKVATHILSIDDSHMVHTTRIFDILAFSRGYKNLFNEFQISTSTGALVGPGWANVHSLSHADIMNLITDGASKYPLPDFTIKQYTGKLVPLQMIPWQAPNMTDPWGPRAYVAADINGELLVPTGLTEFPLQITQFMRARIVITDALGASVYTTIIEATSTPGTLTSPTWRELHIPLAAGRYQVTLHAENGRNGGFEFRTWKGVPLTIKGGIYLPKQPGFTTLYFYVPSGQTKVVLYTYDAFTSTTQFLDSHGNVVPIAYRDHGRVIVATVPAGESGKVWSVKNLVEPNDPFQMFTTPQTFSLEPQVLMVPSDAL